MTIAKPFVTRVADQSDIVVLEQQVKWYRSNVVWAFYEGPVPVVLQGQDGEHALAQPVTAKQVRRMCALVERYERLLRDTELHGEAMRIRAAVEAIDGEIIPALPSRPKQEGAFRRLVQSLCARLTRLK